MQIAVEGIEIRLLLHYSQLSASCGNKRTFVEKVILETHLIYVLEAVFLA
jgi:hypothetical protein